MLLNQTPTEFKARFLLKLTKELVKNTQTYKEAVKEEEIKVIIKQKEQETKQLEQLRKIIPPSATEIKKREIRNNVSIKLRQEHKKVAKMDQRNLPNQLKVLARPAPTQVPVRRVRAPIPPPRIPEPTLPPTVSYLRPTPDAEQIDLGKLNPLIQDPLVKIIECNGAEENVFVIGIMGRKPTRIKLNKEELREIIDKVSKATKIPAHEGLFKAALGRFVISAVISDIAGIRFVIRKISQEQYY
jgi:hypothetical protein